jgi:hypothetical protein
MATVQHPAPLKRVRNAGLPPLPPDALRAAKARDPLPGSLRAAKARALSRAAVSVPVLLKPIALHEACIYSVQSQPFRHDTC